MKKLLSVILASVITIFTFAQNNTANNTLLWKVSGKDIKQPSYLFGTLHMLCQDKMLWNDAMEQAFGTTEQLYLELPMADANFQQEMMQSIILTDGKQLKDYFSDDDYQKLSAYMRDSMQMDIAQFAPMKPLGLMSLFAMKSVSCNGQPPVAYETMLISKAAEKNFTTKGLETIGDQIKVFDDLPKDSMAAMIMSYINNAHKTTVDYNRMLETYLNQDINALYQEFSQSPEILYLKPSLLDNRNKNWAKQIPAIAKDKATFFAFGAGHLGGAEGVINLLRKQGYKVEPVK